MRRAPQAVRAAAAVVAVEDSAVVAGVAIVAAVAAVVVADAGIAGNSNRVFHNPRGRPNRRAAFFLVRPQALLRYALDARVSKSYLAAADLE
jgi:hypothetical protein